MKTESRYTLTETEDMIAACLGHAYKAAQQSPRDSEARADAVWDVKHRLTLELSLARPTFNSDSFVAAIQRHYELASGF
jgi:hypothetical protein